MHLTNSLLKNLYIDTSVQKRGYSKAHRHGTQLIREGRENNIHGSSPHKLQEPGICIYNSAVARRNFGGCQIAQITNFYIMLLFIILL